jgi:antirestriction protein
MAYVAVPTLQAPSRNTPMVNLNAHAFACIADVVIACRKCFGRTEYCTASTRNTEEFRSAKWFTHFTHKDDELYDKRKGWYYTV